MWGLCDRSYLLRTEIKAETRAKRSLRRSKCRLGKARPVPSKLNIALAHLGRPDALSSP